MNLFLHSIGELDGEPLVERSDALITEPRRKVDYVLANPPFGKKSSMTITNEEGEEDKEALTYERQDFWETTSNKQLNFLQHIVSMLKRMAKRRWCCRTTCYLKAARARRSAASCWKTAMCTPCCGCPQASSTRRA
jgi:methylase of polypeptide subunit release factors